MTIPEQLNAAVNKLAKWRGVFAGWQLGTRPKGDPESDAVRDHRELTILMRAELNALTAVLIAKGAFTVDEFNQQLILEAKHLDESFEKRFPGIRSTEMGLAYDTRCAETMKGWKP